jgi:secondary thiamine-phosphate synthase enzyme
MQPTITIESNEGARVRSATFSIQVTAAERLGCVDVTDELLKAIKDSGVSTGCAVAFVAHTTCSLIINEWEDGALEDLKAKLDAIVPVDAYYSHDDMTKRTQNIVEDERENGHAHVLQMLVGGTSHSIPVADGAPMLGTWQRLFLLELDEPKPRTITFHTFGG